MVDAYHLILGLYGFWLPDPKGSWPQFVSSFELLRYGNATTVAVTQEDQDRLPHHLVSRMSAEADLKYPKLKLTGLQARAIGQGFSHRASYYGFECLACAIVPDHIQLVILCHSISIEQIANLLKGSATRELRNQEIHPFKEHPTRTHRFPKAFARGQWSVRLENETEIPNAVEYVEALPEREGLPKQQWKFVKSL
jgi:REP element-mobilizing transposase RayT